MRKLNRVLSLALSAVALVASSAFADESKTMFPFVIEKGSPDNITNVQTWDKPAPEAGSEGFFVDKVGEFANDVGVKRLMGTNFCFTADFPSKEKAERVAATIARFGIGVVRLHHMDSYCIWGDNMPNSTTEIDPKQLDRLDYLIYCFHKNGVYVNINLHVSRAFRDLDGFENTESLPTQNKGVDNFCRKMIELQKKYAKDLLQHVNPYTGLAYVDDPGVAVVEINNENSVVASWSWGQLDDLQSPYLDEFQKYWNEWLVKKYGDDKKLREVWGCETLPWGEEMIPDGRFDKNFEFNKNQWSIESDALTKYNVKVLSPEETGIDSCAIRFDVEKMGEVNWRPQFHRVGLKIEAGKPYMVRLKVRSKNSDKFVLSIKEHHEPWGSVGFQTDVKATPEWKEFEIPFVAMYDDDNVRLTFNNLEPNESFEIADVSMKQGGVIGILDTQTLAAGTVPIPKHSGDPHLLGAAALADFADFLHDLENGYWQEMYQYVKSLGVKQLTTGTQLQYGYWYNQARLDYCDIHAYWNHPNFPGRSWDHNDWFVRNSCLANSPHNGTLANLASLRVLGRPFTCSEYDHPYPNLYNAEGNLMMAAVAAFQDWSATFQFAWSHSDNFEREAVDPFFDMCSNTVKMAHLPACYAMFVRGDVKSGPGEFVYAPQMSEAFEMQIMNGALYDYHRSLDKGLELDKSLSLAVYAGLDLTDLNLKQSDAFQKAKKIKGWSDLPEKFGSKEKKEIVNEFGEIRWNFQEKDKGFFTVDVPNCKVFSGFVTKPTEFDALTLDVGETELGWATVSLVKGTNAESKAEKIDALTPGRYLLTATGLMKNTDSKLVYKGEDVTLAGAYGGSNGKAPILCEGVPAKLTLKNVKADSVEVYALNARGDRAQTLDVQATDSGAVVAVGPEFKTIWYEIVVK